MKERLDRSIRYQERYDRLKDYMSRKPRNRLASVRLFGPPATGKSYMVRNIAKDIGADIFTISGSPQVCNEDLTGFFTIESGRSRWNDGIVIQAMKNANRGRKTVLEITEMNALKPECMLSLYELLSYDRCVTERGRSSPPICLENDAEMVLVAEDTLGPMGIRVIQESFDDKFEVTMVVD